MRIDVIEALRKFMSNDESIVAPLVEEADAANALAASGDVVARSAEGQAESATDAQQEVAGDAETQDAAIPSEAEIIVARFAEVEKTLADVAKRLIALEKNETERKRAWLSDLSAYQTTTTDVVRARAGEKDGEEVEETKPTYAELADKIMEGKV